MNKIIFKLTLGFLTLGTLSSCNEDKECDNTIKEPLKTVAKQSLNSTDGEGIAIAFYYQDSLATQFRFFREIDSLLSTKELAYRNELEKKMRSYQTYEAEIQKRYENNEITGYEIEGIQQTMLEKQQAIQIYEQQQGEALQRETLQYQTVLMNKVAEAGKEFSNIKGIDLLFFYQKGGQITFINNAYDVTSEFIEFLNQREDELKSGFKDDVKAINLDGL